MSQWRKEEEETRNREGKSRYRNRGGVGGPSPPRPMKIISWNCRGLGNSWEVRALLRLNRIENPKLMFLMETHLQRDEFQNIKRRSGFEGCLTVYCRGAERERAGSLALLWKEGILLSINSYCLNHIGGFVNDESDQHEWFFSDIYGHSEEHNKRKTWILLMDLARRGGERFVYFGDLNDVLCESEKLEGNSKLRANSLRGGILWNHVD